MQCRDVMLTLVFKCDPSVTAEAFAKVMRDERLGFILRLRYF